jgi:hypothetical protein
MQHTFVTLLRHFNAEIDYFLIVNYVLFRSGTNGSYPYEQCDYSRINVVYRDD